MVPARPRFPLPREYFDHSPLSKEQQEHYKEIAQTQLDAAVKTENEFTSVQRRQVNSRRWRLVKKQEQLRIYRRRSGSLGPADAHALPHMLAVGHVDGSLEDIMYGKYDKSHEELQSSMACSNVSIRDSAVLHNIELATPSDPFRYLGLKWTLTQLPAAALVKPRDWLWGSRQIATRTIRLRDCALCRMRGRGSFSAVFREVKPGRVEIFGYGLFDPLGDLIPHVSVTMTTEIFSTLGKAVQCAEAKKLTLLALRNYNSKRGSKPPLQPTCYLCVKSTGLFASLKLCNVCGATACAKCRVKRLIFTGGNHSTCEVVCCQTCILRAKNLEVRPAQESFAASFGEQHQQQVVPGEAMWHGSHQWKVDSTDDDRQLFSHHDTLDDTADDDDDERNSSTGKSEADFEQIIETMMTSRVNGHDSHNFSSSQLSQKTASSSNLLGRLYENERISPRTILANAQTRNNASTVASEQAALFNQMLALQHAARHVYAITQANQEMMKKL
uniref:FYVE-type domain-containing protein n=1 Tax=Globisporangium ultimum (strain ATCC 200006 / CBS 805.95 / DAOM BR144) TaxID=431595 RepID=K3WS26_GLOUD